MDFGFNNATAVIDIWFYEGDYYISEYYYKTGHTVPEFVEWAKQDGMEPYVPIYCDPSRPDSINVLVAAGFNAHPGNNRVADGLDYVKGHRLHIDQGSINLIKELRAYKYKENKDGRILDVPVDFMDHGCDAMRYGIFTEPQSSGAVPETPVGPSPDIPIIKTDYKW